MNLIVPAAAVVAVLLLTNPRRRRTGGQQTALFSEALPASSDATNKGGGTAPVEFGQSASSKNGGGVRADAPPVEVPRPSTMREAVSQLQVGLREYVTILNNRIAPRVSMAVPTGMTVDGVFGPVTARYLAYFQRTHAGEGMRLAMFASGRVSESDVRAALALLAPCGGTFGVCPTPEQIVTSQRSQQVWSMNVVSEMAHIVIRFASHQARIDAPRERRK